VNHSRIFVKALIAAVVLTVLADVFVYGAMPGAGYGILTLLIAAGILISRGREAIDSVTIVLLALIVGIALQFVIQPSASGFFLGILLVMSLSFHTVEPYRSDPAGFLRRSVLSSVASIWYGVGEIVRRVENKAKKSKVRAPKWWIIAVPAFLLILFGLMLANANPVFNKMVSTAWHSAWEWVGDVLAELNALRFIFWALFFACVYGLLRMSYIILTGGPRQPELIVQKADRKAELMSCLLSMGSLNVLFLIVNIIDLFYLWGSAALPEGVTYAKYAHTGSYRLIVTVIISAIVVCAFYRRGTLQEESRPARWLVYGWVGQNIFLVLSALRRLLVYVDAYGLTRWRVAVIFWVALVVCGFILVIVKVARNWSALKLVKANLLSTLVLFYVVGFWNTDGTVAHYNVTRYLEGRTTQMDIDYLAGLDCNAVPAIARLRGAKDPEIAAYAAQVVADRVMEMQEQARDWRSYYVRRSNVLNSLTPAEE
jgi:cytochrome c oxidase subunit IV